MSTEYYPDCWVPLRFYHPEHGTTYKVFAGWHGGFANPNSWKLSSGITKIERTAAGFAIRNDSGSIYNVCADTKMSLLMAQMYEGWQSQLADMQDVAAVSLSIVELEDLLDEFGVERYILKGN